MNIELLTLGNELLDGRRVDTNTAWIGRFLTSLGLQVRFRQTTLDQKKDIVDAFRLALTRSDLIISTGGLGPTQDDITFESLAEALEQPLMYHSDIEEKIQEKYRIRGIPCPPSNRRQAMLPKSATPISNPLGTAPGCFIRFQDKMIFCFPGVPAEMKHMMQTFFANTLQSKMSSPNFFQQTYCVFGIAESRVEEMIQELGLDRNSHADVNVAYTASQSQVDVTFSIQPHDPKNKDSIFLQMDATFMSVFSENLTAWHGKSIQEHIVETFQKKNWKLAIAESLTGGMITSKIVDVPGCSSMLHQGLITYSYESKKDLLDVKSETLQKHGAVSVECVLEMAKGILKKTGANIALATTGIAGPGGATEQKPLGLTYIAWIGPKFELTSEKAKSGKYVKSTDFQKKVGPKTQNADMYRNTNMIEEHILHDENGLAVVQGFVFSGDRERNRMSATYRALMGLHTLIQQYVKE